MFGNPDASGVIQQLAAADLGNTFSTSDLRSPRAGRRSKIADPRFLRHRLQAPSPSDIAGPLVFNGSTEHLHLSVPGYDGLHRRQRAVRPAHRPNGPGGSDGLTGKSTQVDGRRAGTGSRACRWAPTGGTKIKQQVLSQGIPEQVAFANPQQYAALFTNPYTDPVGGFNTIALAQIPFNGGRAEYEGLDWDLGEGSGCRGGTSASSR